MIVVLLLCFLIRVNSLLSNKILCSFFSVILVFNELFETSLILWHCKCCNVANVVAKLTLLNSHLFNVMMLQINSPDSKHHHTTPQLFYGPFSRTTRVSLCQKRTSGLYCARGDLQRQTH